MEFAFTPQQIELRDAVRSVLAGLFPRSELRAVWDRAASRDPGAGAVWTALGRLGVFDVLSPESTGGLGLDWCSLVLVLEETGRVALPHPVVARAAVLAPLVGSASPGIEPGTLLSTSLAGESAVWGGDSEKYVIDHDDALWLVDRTSVTGHSLDSLDKSRRLFAIGGVDWSRAACLATGPADVAAALDRAALGSAAQLLGLAQAMLDLTVAYVGDRQQFGVPVGSFQAVKHHLADALKELAFARPVVYRAAWSLACGDTEAPIHVSMAKAMAADAASAVARAALQCHGAIGYAYEYDLHMFMKRVWALARADGTPAWHRARVGRAIA